MPTANFVPGWEKKKFKIRGDLWIDWTESKGTFCLKRNNSVPVFPLTLDESKWVREQIKKIFKLN